MKRWGLVLLLIVVLVALLILGLWLGQKLGVGDIIPGNRNQIVQVSQNVPIQFTDLALLDKLFRVAAKGETNAPQRIEWIVERGEVPLDDSVAAYLPDTINRGGRLIACSQPIKSEGGRVASIKIIVSDNAKEVVSRGDITEEKVANLVMSCIIRAVSDNRQAEFIKIKSEALQPILTNAKKQPILLNL